MPEPLVIIVKFLWLVSAILGLIVIGIAIPHAILIFNECKNEEFKEPEDNPCIFGIALTVFAIILGVAQILDGLLNLCFEVNWRGLASQHVGFVVVAIVIFVYQIVLQVSLDKATALDFMNDTWSNKSKYVHYKKADGWDPSLDIFLPKSPCEQAKNIFIISILDFFFSFVVLIVGCVLG